MYHYKKHNVEALTQAVLHASKQRFGASSEKTPFTDAPVIPIKEHKRPLRKKGDRVKQTQSLERETVECVLNPEEAACEICGSELNVIGKKTVRSEMEYIPAKLIMKDYVQYIYKCVECGTNDENPFDAIFSAQVPAPVLKHSFASPSSAAWIMYQKYVLSVPFYRQERDFLRMGAALRRDTMAYWVIRCAEDWLKPLYDRMHSQLLKCGIIMSDETTWQVNHEPGRKASSKSYI